MMDPLWLMLIGMLVVVGGILVFRLHAFLALILAAVVVATLTGRPALEQYTSDKGMGETETDSFLKLSVGKRVAAEFGRTCAKIGILIAMASIIGKCLLESGAAERIVRSALRLFGERGAPLGFLCSGFVLAIPVFFDTVFYLMLPLAKSMGIRSKRNYGLYIMAIVASGVMAHSLVPPTPGPLLVAGELSVNIGLMIIGGIVVGVFTTTVGYLYALCANRWWTIPVRDSGDISMAELSDLAQKSEGDLPPLWLSLAPIVLPILLISGKTILKSLADDASASSGLQFAYACIKQIGDPNLALIVSGILALILLASQKRGKHAPLAPAVQSALSTGGVIILITSAGGAFGGVLQQTGVGHRIEELAAAYQIGILPLAFFVTALVRTAQGSATVAMVTAVGITGGLASGGQLEFHPVYLALVIGCGSKLVAWMNDSGFWVICKMSGMKESETLKTCSIMMAIMGLSGLLFVMLLARLFPLV
ncbi:MAG: GntP family permease [Planctomycetes bacterium]|nr:GntP family permease [Planctomycetota bacterium]